MDPLYPIFFHFCGTKVVIYYIKHSAYENSVLAALISGVHCTSMKRVFDKTFSENTNPFFSPKSLLSGST